MFTLDENEDAVGYGRLIYNGRYFGLPVVVIQEIKRLQANSNAYVQFLEEVQSIATESEDLDISYCTDECVCFDQQGNPLNQCDECPR